MYRSILNDVKKMLGPDNDTVFDEELIMFINNELETLSQVGACPKGSCITSNLNTWSDIFDDQGIVSKAKAFIFYEVKLSFDPPQSSFAIESFKKKADEALWRINHDADFE